MTPRITGIRVGLLCAVSGMAQAQLGNPLIGEWQGIVRDPSNNVSGAFDIAYFPNNTFVQTLAMPQNRQTGTGSGIIYSRGQYQMTSDHTVAFNEQERKACPNGDMNFCAPIPLTGIGDLSFRMEGPDTLINAATGDTFHRVR